ncbi:MAG TPA: hypothetical protein VFN61_01200 [Acidimicrobiales bacterium]|nr:hypothetical protein [Acidimicrobiales bacterium]
MTITDWVLDIALIGIVIFQVRGRRLTARNLLLPLAIVAYVAFDFLRSVPTSGNNLVLIGLCTAVGVALGAGAGYSTRLQAGPSGSVLAKAGPLAAVLWVVGVGMRLAFQLYATHGGGASIARFSAHHALSITGWVAALILMAIGEALARTVVLAGRAFLPAWRPGAAMATQP